MQHDHILKNMIFYKWQAHVWPQEHILKKLGGGLLSDAT